MSNLQPNQNSTWIEQTFKKRECIQFIPTAQEEDCCACGLPSAEHIYPSTSPPTTDIAWNVQEHTQLMPTDAHGTIEFHGGAHPSRAQYVRVDYDTQPADLMTLFKNVWHIEPPKLVITVRGGIANFDVQSKLKRVFSSGLLRAACTTGAWIITSGIDAGVVQHVADALGDTSNKTRSSIVSIGIAPWGLLRKRDELRGREQTVPYHAKSFPPGGRYAALNDKLSYFLLVDNGTTGKYGADVVLRKRLEEWISQKVTLSSRRNVPVVCVVLEGGSCTIRAVLDYVTAIPPIPVVVCDGSGRAADLLAFVHHLAVDVTAEGGLPGEVRTQLEHVVAEVFGYNAECAEALTTELIMCVQQRQLMTIYRLGEEHDQDVDEAILTAILKGQLLPPPDELALAMAWNRADIAQTHIFILGQSWPPGSLETAMFRALVENKVEFVKLLLENGVSMGEFLTIKRLDDLYNASLNANRLCTLSVVLKDVTRVTRNYRSHLTHIGWAIERLMGGAYKSSYTSRLFRHKYAKHKSMLQKIQSTLMPQSSKPDDTVTVRNSKILELTQTNNHLTVDACNETQASLNNSQSDRTSEQPPNNESEQSLSSFKTENDFAYPFNELLVWAVLTSRQPMALCLWQHGEQAFAKALVASKLYKSLAKVASDDHLDGDIVDELRENSNEFRRLAVELLAECHREDDDKALQLLTYELENWGRQTCLSLAVMANNKECLAHVSCQVLLADLWAGGLRIRRNGNLKVVAGLLCPPLVMFLDFKTKDELMNQPQTAAEHAEDLSNQSSEASNLELVAEASMAPQVFEAFAPHVKERRLPLSKRFYEFYVAPITTFWALAVSYAVFLVVLTYILLVQTPAQPSNSELFVILYIVNVGLEMIRKWLMSEPRSYLQKLRVFTSSYWNNLTCFAVITFLIGVVLRLNGLPHIARVIYAINAVFWYMKLLEILSVHSRLGPYITMVGKMILNMVYIIIILLVVLVSFGVVRQSITYPDEVWSWMLVRNIFYKPYFMLYGEVYAPEIAPCGDLGEQCVPGQWLVPIAMAAFMLVANILLINLLIAIFNNIYIETNSASRKIWMFQRYGQVMEYESSPFLPPPFTIICHVVMLVRYFLGRRQMRSKSAALHGKQYLFDNGLKLFLNEDQQLSLHKFEEECMDELTRRKLVEKESSHGELLRGTHYRAERMNMKLRDIIAREVEHMTLAKSMHENMTHIRAMQLQLFEQLAASSKSLRDSSSQLATGSGGLGRDVTPVAPNNDLRRASVDDTAGVQPPSGPVYSQWLSPEDQSGRPPASSSGGKPRVTLRKPTMQLPGEYTSITDGIQVTVELADAMDEGSSLVSGQVSDRMKHAKPSFVAKQNAMLKEFEETSSHITGVMLEGRIRQAKNSISNASGQLGGYDSSDGAPVEIGAPHLAEQPTPVQTDFDTASSIDSNSILNMASAASNQSKNVALAHVANLIRRQISDGVNSDALLVGASTRPQLETIDSQDDDTDVTDGE